MMVWDLYTPCMYMHVRTTCFHKNSDQTREQSKCTCIHYACIQTVLTRWRSMRMQRKELYMYTVIHCGYVITYSLFEFFSYDDGSCIHALLHICRVKYIADSSGSLHLRARFGTDLRYDNYNVHVQNNTSFFNLHTMIMYSKWKEVLNELVR